MPPIFQIPFLARRWFAWRPGAYLRASAGLLGWLLVRAVAQAAMVLLLTWTLGAEGYGQFVALLAIASFFTPLVGLGLPSVLLRDGARFPERLPELLSHSLAIWWRSAVVFSLVAIGTTLWLLPIDIHNAIIVIFIGSEIGSASLSELVARIEQSQHPQRFGAILTGLIVMRLLSLTLYAALTTPDVNGWLRTYAGSSALYILALLIWVQMRWHPKPFKRFDTSLVREGWPFTVGALSLRLQAEFNKPVLAQLGYTQVGHLSAAQRVVDMASLPLQAMQEVFWSKLYAISKSQRRLWLTGGILVATALISGGMLIWLSPWIPLLFGAGFEGTIKVLHILAFLPAVQMIRNLGIAVLIIRSQHVFLTQIYIASGICCVVLNGLLVPYIGLSGALWSAYLSEVVALVMLSYRIILSR